ncbi:MAG: 2-C-methyl-D-erythritol 2,4-cyclodiphosphate synthase [Spirochaetaceae bacterium]|jgi:2-C-methyl-D-erythritol 2,4-cyclodiphosphate synthase|nr:2-C-methyl-D-erythritol 2,4-cyclodiphosphate synthase [Spirochaetaceae bacterium]
MIRIGLGRDIHRLVPGRPFLLAGLELPAERGELGHSDGDVLAHAVTDALLGAAGLGDIGEFFPPEDSAWRDADSMGLLKTTYKKVKDRGWKPVNVDCIVICETPRILPYREPIRDALAAVLELPREAVFVKGKTNEGMGPVGEGLAVEALTVCLLERE